MKNILTKINESKFGYIWQNALVCSLKSLAETDDKKCIGIIDKWFESEDEKHQLYVFLYRLGYEPESKSAVHILDAIKQVQMDDKYNLK